MQSITSAKTSVRQLPGLFIAVGRSGGWRPGTVNLDIGGGRYDEATAYLAARGVENRIFDPYNRSKEHNTAAVGPADSVTVANVLNVVREEAHQHGVILLTHAALRPGGVAYFSAYEGDRSGDGRPTVKGFQHNLPLRAYLALVRRFFPSATLRGKVIVAVKD
jgi:hypothetical protein